jgi:hypothetical protein
MMTGTAPFTLTTTLTNKVPTPNLVRTCNLTALPSMEVVVQETRLRAERLQIMLDAEEVAALDNFRFTSRMPSRASAVRELLKRGLAAEGFLTAAVGAKSTDFGVTGKVPGERRR